MLIRARETLRHFFLAECGRCGFVVEGEMRNGYGGWKEIDCNTFSRICTHRAPNGRPTMVCPHLRAARLAAQPLTHAEFVSQMRSGFAPAPCLEQEELAATP